MEKTRFRGERKRILTPSLSQGEGECSDSKEECSDGKNNETSPYSHTPLSRTSIQRGNIATERESSPRSHTLLFGDFSQGEGECSDGKGK